MLVRFSLRLILHGVNTYLIAILATSVHEGNVNYELLTENANRKVLPRISRPHVTKFDVFVLT